MPSQHAGFDPDALRVKYRQERDKRLREDGNDQYVEVADRFAHFVEDPFVPERAAREPLTDEVEALIVGGGFGGLLIGAYLRKQGFESVRIVDKASDVGGTWYWNRYPGAQCDIESYIYMPLLEEVGYIPKEKYSFGDEIWKYTRSLATTFDLYRDACFQTGVTELRWDDDAAMWVVSTDRGDRIRAHFVIQATGVLNRPKLPAVDGIDDFGGHTFHTSRWDYDYTGGGPGGGLTKLSDKRVGIIGTGASAIQCVPHLAAWAQHLYVFQRTPSSVDVRGNRPTDPEWVAGLGRGWQQQRITNFNVLVSGGFQEQDLVHDAWTDLIGRLADFLPKDGASAVSPEDAARASEMADFEKMESIRARSTRPSPTRRRPRRSSRTTGSSASARASTTSTCRPSTGPTSRSSTRTAKAWPGSPRTPSSSATSATRSSASSSPRASRSARTGHAAPGSRRSAVVGVPSGRSGATARGRSTASRAGTSRTCSSWGSPRRASRRTTRRCSTSRPCTSPMCSASAPPRQHGGRNL